MADYTPNYGLHQWEASDSFLRTDFNQDFSKIDAALGRAERSSQANAYNLYNLMLQNYYESKYTGYKKALIFDGFLDAEGVAALTDGLAVDTANRCLLLDGAGQGSFSHNYGNTVGAYISAGSTLSYTFTPTGRGTVTGAQVYLDGTATVSVTDASGTVLASAQNSGSGGSVWFGLSAQLRPGQSYTLKLTNGTSGNIVVKRQSESGDLFGFSLSVTPEPVTGGALTSALRVPGPWSQALAWVRYGGGTVGLSLGGAAMTAGESREAQTLPGEPCTEQAFILETGGAGGEEISLTLQTSPGQQAKVYDYGVLIF